MPNDLIGWDADFYNSLTDTIKNVSLTEKEIYVLGNLLPMVSWSNRWSGDISGLDLDAIRGEMEFTIMDEIEVSEMSCEDIADCIGTESIVQDAIEQSLIADGFAPNPDTDLNTNPPPSLTPTASAMELLPDGFDCESQPQIAMGLARAIVSELHSAAEDFFELIEYATNAAEGLAMASEQIPYFGTAISGALEFMDWVLETMKETYEAAYNQSVEDELACMIFCHIMDGCTLSIDDLIALYEDKGSITIPPANDIDAVLTFATGYSFSPDVVCVAVFHYQVLRFMAWGAIGGFSAAYLQSLMNYNVSASDYSYETLCDDCVEPDDPTTYWALHLDFRVSQHNTGVVIVNGSNQDGIWRGNGYGVVLLSTAALSNANFGYPDLGAQYVIKAQATRSVRRGSTGNGTHDFANMYTYPNANYGGASTGTFTHNFIADDGNDVEVGLIVPASTVLARSFVFRTRLNRFTNASPAPELRTYETIVWGLPDGSGNKPPRSYWAGNTLPSTVPELFPDYVAP